MVEKDPFLNFISDLSEKIKVSREHKQIMERVNDPKGSVDENKGSLENLILTIKEKIETANLKTVPSLSSSQTLALSSKIIKVVSEEENNFSDFVDKLKNILSKPRDLQTTTTAVSSVSASEQVEIKTPATKKYIDVLNQPKVKKTNKTKTYVEELDKVKDGITIEKEDTKVIEIKKLIEDYAEKYIKKAIVMSEYAGGGGTNAVQYANGGTMNGDLNVNGNYLSGGVNLLNIFTGGGGGSGDPAVNALVHSNSAQWNEAYTNLVANSGNWESTFTTVQTYSAGWSSGLQTLTFNESNYDLSISNGNTVNLSSINTTFNANSGKYESNFTTTNSNSAQWSEAYTNLVANSALYLSGYVDNRYFYKDINFNATPNTKYSTGTSYDSITATLPSNSVIGDSVEFFDADGMWDINPLIVDNNGYNIESVYDSLSCDVRYGIFKLINTTPNSLGWRIVPLPRHSEINNSYKFIGLKQDLKQEVLIASTCGRSDVSLSAFNLLGGDYQAFYPGGTYTMFISYEWNAPQTWELIRVDYPSYTFTYLYSAAGTFTSAPLVGWSSRSPSYDPPPTFTTNAPTVSSLFNSYNLYFPRLDNNDIYFKDSKTIIAFVSSIEIPIVTTLDFSTGISVSSIDLSYFKSLSALTLITTSYDLSSINLTRNPNLQTLNISNNYSLRELDIRNNKKLTYINSSGNSNLSSIKWPENLSNVTFLSLNNTGLPALTASKISGNPNILSNFYVYNLPSLSTLVLKNINFMSSTGYSRIYFSSNSNLQSVIFTSCSADELLGAFLPKIKDIDLTNCTFSAVYFNYNTSLSGLLLPQRLKSIDLTNCSSLSSSFVINNILSTINTNNYTNGTIGYDGTNSSRTFISNNDLISLLVRNYYITPMEMDVQPFPSRPLGYVSSQDTNSITVMCPISTRNDSPALYGNNQYDYYSTRFNVLTGEYLKVSETYNNRDVWRNPNNYFILFNATLSGWTLVGPLSTSSNILLSASESYVEWGTPPSVGWFGKAFQSGGFTGGISYNPATYGSVWGQSTTVASTKNTLFSSFYWGSNNGYDYANQGYLAQGQGRMFGLPSAGYNSSFYWKDYDFTGLLYNTGATPMNTGRGVLISPIHFLCQNHYLPWGGSGTTGQGQSLVLYNANGTTTTRTVLSSIQYPAGSDTRVGILNSPVTNTFYPVASGSLFCSNVTTSFNKLSCFLVGPSQSSRCGLMPIRASGVGFNWYVSPVRYNTMSNSFYKNSYSVPRSLIFGESIAGGDSSTQVWFLSAETKRPILIGGIQFGGGSGPAFGADPYIPFLKGAMDNLSNQFSLPIYSPILVDK